MGGNLWKAYAGNIRLGALEPYTVIDRCAASVRDLTFTVGSGGQRTYGLRPLEPDASLREQNRSFFEGLKTSLDREGQKLPILVWEIKGKVYVRYGASRVWAARQLGWEDLACVLCSFSRTCSVRGFYLGRELWDPADILDTGFWSPAVVGDFEASHERLDAHRMEPMDEGRVYEQ